jgi:hypothetical protein
MRYTLAIIMLCAACAFSQERVIDTVYTDTHKVTYVIDTLNTNDGHADEKKTAQDQYSYYVSKTPEKDTLGISAPPNKFNKITLLLIAQNLNFNLNYEHLFSDFWGFPLRFGYNDFDNKDIRKNTDAEGTIKAFTVPLAIKWFWGRRNTGKYHYVDATGGNHHHTQSQVESYLQAQIVPTLYNVNLQREKSDYKESLSLNEKEYASYFTLGFGGHFCYEYLVFGAEINFGTFISKPKFMEKISVANSRYGTQLLNKYVVQSILSVGWMF